MTAELNTAQAEKANPEALSSDSTSRSQNVMDEVNSLRAAGQTTNDTAQKGGGCYELPTIAIKDNADRLGVKERFEPPKLTVTESFMTNSIMNAIDEASPERIQSALRAVADQTPQSAERILDTIRHRMELRDPLNSVGHILGKDQDGNNYARLSITQRHSWAKSAGSTTIAIGTDGEWTAAHRESAMSPSQRIDAGLGLALIGKPRKIDERPLRDHKPYEKSD